MKTKRTLRGWFRFVMSWFNHVNWWGYSKVAVQNVRSSLRWQLILTFTLCSLCAMLIGAIEECVPLAEQNDLTFVKQLPEQRLYASVDPDQFVRVLENLFSNAVKYSDKPGQIRVTLADEEDALQISVVNWGRPIAKQDLPRLFERFYRVEQSRLRRRAARALGWPSPAASSSCTAAASGRTASGSRSSFTSRCRSNDSFSKDSLYGP